MKTELTGKMVAKNVMISTIAQIVSMALGLIINLIVPKLISVYDYSYWQTYILYIQFVGMLHFGLIDGMVLRYSQYDYNELNKDSVRSQYKLVIYINMVLSILFLFAAFFIFDGVARKLCILLMLTSFAEISYNYISKVFQTTNRIAQYAVFTIVYRCMYCVLIVVLLVSGFQAYYWYCLAYIIADVLVVFTFGIKHNKQLMIGKMLPIRETVAELKITLSSGFWLMIAMYSAGFVIGFGKMIIQWRWDALTFAQISLAFSMTGFILQFITASNVVLLPSIKRIDPNKLPGMYMTIRDGISPLLILALILYFPGSYLLELWLPNYASSITYLGILFPIIVFTSKVSLLTNNYLKAYRKEKQLFTINVVTVAASFVFFLICAYLLNNLTLLLIGITTAIMARSIVSEIIAMSAMGIRTYIDFVWEFIITAIFIICTLCFSRWYGFGIYIATVITYIIIKRKSILYAIRKTVSIKRKLPDSDTVE